TNTVYVGEGEEHAGLNRKGLFIKEHDIHWVAEEDKMETGETRDYQVRIRYRQTLFNAKLEKTQNGLIIHFENYKKAVAKGQFAAWYDGDKLVGSGVIQ
ncbi:MAG: tRNA 2-thiouridine(34) synthase MnmA, partial [Bacteroidia bacterium]|nr:tRNA 2-thiouridine(34) synthase MnmA [Bacteroidia bacterium]NNJ55581.1 tRNA 2-thiouridine(34) synthase MnmA [Bacteroidia bacterium]